MKKRLMSMLLVLCMVFTLFPSAVFAEKAEVTIGTSSDAQDTSSDAQDTSRNKESRVLCKNHKEHDTDCGYIEAVKRQPCDHLNKDGSYSCAPVKDDGDVATSSEIKEKYVCDHNDNCGYAEAVEGADCTHECELCLVDNVDKDIIADACVCGSLCTEGLVNPDCPVCAAVGADLTKCKGKEAEKLPVCDCVVKCTSAPECVCPTVDSGELVHGEDCPLSDSETAVAHINPDCPVCPAEGADLTKCVGAEAMMMAMPRGTVIDVSTLDALNDAIAAAIEDMNFRLTAPMTGKVIINGTTHNLTIDLNGQTLSGESNDFVINHAGTKTLTITDSSAGKNGKITTSGTAPTIQVQGNAVLEITGGTVENTSTGMAIYHNGTSKTVISSGSPVIKSSGGEAMSKAPDVSSYDGVKVTASVNYSGTPTTPYIPADIATYKYLTFGVSAVKNTTTNAEYDTLQAAIDAVAEGNTLQLQKNLTEKVKIVSGNSISFTIDLNGQTLDGGNDYTISHRGTGKLTIKDSDSNGTITSSFGEWGTVYCSNAGATDTVLEVIGGTITNTSTVYSYGIYIYTDAKVSISGGTITGNSYAVSIDSRKSATLTITGGVLDGKFGVVFYTGATVSIPSGSPVIKGSTQAMSQAPDFTGYTNVKVTASKNHDGSSPEAAYDAAKINDYKYLTFGVDATTEQFTLPTGETYYFDLSGELGTVTNGVSSTIGTINVGKTGSGAYPGVPDPTLHYVPFTYTGTVNAYSLESSSSGQTGSSAAATASDRSLFVAEYNISHTKSWDGLNTASLIYGKTLDTNYKLRSMSAGSSRSTDGGINTGAPVTNEWDCILTKNSNYIKNYKNINSYGQDTSASNSTTRTVRGNGSARDYVPSSSSGVTGGCGFRPALEVLNPDTLGADGLNAVTLNLNGGSFDSNGSAADGVVSSLNIVSAGATFKAPSGEGLTPPSGKAFDKWNTAADGNGTSYAVGATVPSSVTALYAQWKDVAPTTKITTTLNLMSVTADMKCTDSNVGTIITGMTQHTHADGTPCWAWDNTTKTLTLNDVDIEVSDAPVDTLFGSGIVLPDAAVTLLFNGSNTVKGDTELNSRGITSQNYSITITGASEDAVLAASGKSTGINASNGTVTITEGKITTSGKSYGIVGSLGITISGGTVTATSTTITLNSAAIWTSGEPDSIKLSGGTIIAQAGTGDAKAFMVEPVLSNGMAHKAGTGTWDNTTGTACVYEKGTAATVTAIAVTPKTASVQKGTTQQFSVAVTGTNNPAQTVTWTVTGGAKARTTISTSGLLTVAADETAASLTVKATSTVDNTKSDTAAVTVTAAPVTKYALTVTGGTGRGDYEAGATVTATANAAPSGQRFKEWTATGITLTDKTQNPATFAMPAGAVSLTALYEPIPSSTYTVTLDASGGSVSPTSLTITAGSTATLPTPSRSGSYRFDGWFTAASGGTQYTNSTPINSNVTLYAHWTYTGGGSGGGSDVTPDKPNPPTKAEVKVDTMTDGSGNTFVTVTDQNINDAIAKAEADARKNGSTANGITIVLSATGGSNSTNVTVNLPKTVQKAIINKKVVSTVIVVDNPDVQIGMDLNAVTEINRQAQSDVSISATRLGSNNLSAAAQTAIGSRPVFDLRVSYGGGKQIQSFGAGGVSVSIPYTLGANEKAGDVCAVYVDGNGTVQWLTSSVYDSTAKVLRFSTNHFSTYGVGYGPAAPAFADLVNHPAKADIEYVVSRGLLSGTDAATFGPDAAMTRGMLVTALGRLVNADVSGYQASSFSDVKAGSYYMGYIEWASKYNIVSGSDGTPQGASSSTSGGNHLEFMPDQSITREQLAVIMSNYARAIGLTLPKLHEAQTFADSAKISSYARADVKAMQMAGIINGKNGNVFDPQGTATRAEVSEVLRRFAQLRSTQYGVGR